jgi:hypothetical protein
LSNWNLAKVIKQRSIWYNSIVDFFFVYLSCCGRIKVKKTSNRWPYNHYLTFLSGKDIFSQKFSIVLQNKNWKVYFKFSLWLRLTKKNFRALSQQKVFYQNHFLHIADSRDLNCGLLEAKASVPPTPPEFIATECLKTVSLIISFNILFCSHPTVLQLQASKSAKWSNIAGFQNHKWL